MSDPSKDPLLSGYRRFRAEHWPEAHAEYETLAEKGQKPHTLIVACSDSRADPALIFDAKPGELFVVRNVANLVPPYEPDGKLHGVSAALEFGVKVLGVKRIVVMGHAHCGGVNAMINGAPDVVADFVAPWIAQGTPVVQHVAETVAPNELERAAEEAAPTQLRGDQGAVHLTPELEQFARDRVNTGRYASMSEVVRDGLRLLQDQEVARQSAEAARREELARQQEESARRQLAFKAMLDRWSAMPSIDIGPWTREELYD